MRFPRIRTTSAEISVPPATKDHEVSMPLGESSEPKVTHASVPADGSHSVPADISSDAPKATETISAGVPESVPTPESIPSADPKLVPTEDSESVTTDPHAAADASAETHADTNKPSPSTPGTRKKSVAKKRRASKVLDVPAEDSTFIEFDDDEEEEPVVWEKVVRWELVESTVGQGQVNLIHREDGSTKHFTFLSEILHMVDRHDIISLYGWVTDYYKSHKPEGIGMFLVGDLYVLCDSSHYVGMGFHAWKGQHNWVIDSWKYFPLSNVHMIFATNGKTLYMWGDVIYPITIEVLRQMLEVKLTVPPDMVGNDMHHAEQLVRAMRRSLLVKLELEAKHGVHLETSLR